MVRLPVSLKVEVHNLIDEGMSYEAAAAWLGSRGHRVSVSWVGRHLKRRTEYSRATGPLLDADIVAKVRKLRDDGMSYGKISKWLKTIGVSRCKEGVRKICVDVKRSKDRAKTNLLVRDTFIQCQHCGNEVNKDIAKAAGSKIVCRPCKGLLDDESGASLEAYNKAIADERRRAEAMKADAFARIAAQSRAALS